MLAALLVGQSVGSGGAEAQQRVLKTASGQGGQGGKGCRQVTLRGEVAAGSEWKAAIGEGWVFRLAPIAEGKGTSYSGWDLVVDREGGGGYPDALLLATPPYGSLSEREVGTTFGLRAQDAIGWNPRHFHFLTSESDLERGRTLFKRVTSPGAGEDGRAASAELLGLMKRAAAGEFRVMDAKLSSGTADPTEFARQWALRLRETPHTVEQQGGESSDRGALKWIRFEAILWLSGDWRDAKGLVGSAAKCAQ